MSELTTCNYCNHQALLEEASIKGLVVTSIDLDVYMAPPNVNIKQLPDAEKEPYFVAWFMAMTSYCVC